MKKLLEFKTKAFISLSILLISIDSTVSAQKKIAIIDAGSSGSRLWVYQVNPKADTVEILFPSKPEHNAKGPALSSIRTDSVYQFLESMASKYNVNYKDSIPLYVLATAGMRMIPQKADSIYSIMNGLNEDHRKFNGCFKLDTAMTISGRYEGFYAWLAANYKANKLTVNGDELVINGNTLGILEIGGASMQIAFATKDDCVVDTISREKLGCIYSKSYLHYGADRIFDRLGSLLTPNCLVSLDKVDGLYDNSTEKFVGLSKPLGVILEKKGKYSEIDSNITEINENRKKDSHNNYHPATNAMYIDWVVFQLNLKSKLCKPDNASDWTEGAALDILINNKEPQSFDYNRPN